MLVLLLETLSKASEVLHVLFPPHIDQLVTICLFVFCEKDPELLFDSLGVENALLYKNQGKENLSGIHNNISFENPSFLKNPFYKELSGVLTKAPKQSFFGPFVFKNSVFLLYKYSEEREKPLTKDDPVHGLYAMWQEFEHIAREAKTNLFLEEWINKQKKFVYVEIFN